ncbi:Miniconductance mechanosensitive channel MscM precursor [Posidoniimonas polymericola]|uniref:Miniconductance mechanosensitive channel MscM n=1 Tax=Posidoniimonas polymericola TaxID=2528002 RepID=A0A5C5ZF32_9BACT|nr:mechanosensitive ion channel domain-containing protein [Posidoniimonas polymericola]TWT85788.1 Miniconductance mechanosensitive channel MscM precursor [Posidoniimonas polymericola]
MSRILCLILACCVVAASPLASCAQAPAEAPVSPAGLDPNEIAQQLAELRQMATDAPAEQLGDDERKQVLELCDKTAGQLTKVKQLKENTARLQREVEMATSGAAPPPTEQGGPRRLQGLAIADLLAAKASADQEVSQSKERLDAVKSEIESRAARRLRLPDAMIETRTKLTKTEEALRADFSADSPLLAQAKRLNLLATIASLRQEMQLLEQENRTYEVTARWKAAQQEAAAQSLKKAEEWLAAVSAQLAMQQQADADRKTQEAQLAVVTAHPAVKAQAQLNAELAEQNSELVQKQARLKAQLDRTNDQSQLAQTNLENVMHQAEELQDSPTIGSVLRSEQDQLPDLTKIRERQRKRAARMSEMRVQKYGWKSARTKPIDVKLAAAVKEYEEQTGETISPEIEQELRALLESRDETLGDLVTNTESYLTDLGKLNAAEALIVKNTRALSDFIAEKVFWVPSAERLSYRDFAYTRDFWTNPSARLADLRTLGQFLLDDAKARPELWLLASMVTLLLLTWRRKAKNILYEQGELAARPAATTFRPTVEALLATVFLAAPTPLMIGFIGYRLSSSTTMLIFATGGALTLFAVQYAVLDLLRHACRRGGLGPAHFAWDNRGMVSLRRAARPMQLVALPLLAIAVGVEITRDAEAIQSIGRLSLILSLLVMGVVGMMFFRPRGPLVSVLTAAGEKLWVARLVRLLGPLTVAATLGLALASGLGMHYTALQLTRRVLFSAGVVFGCLAVRAMLMRWLLVAYRRVAMQRAREKRKALLEAQENAPTENAAIEVEPEVSLSDINQQARSLVGVGVGASIVGLLLMAWGDVLPALNALTDPDTFGLWASGIPDDNGAYPWVTLGSVILSIGVFCLTWFAGRNVPGLLEIALFQKLPLDAGARYAATSVSRYVIVVIGVVIGMRFLGIGWQSVQWLVAAMTVGLGFGLQEIFANFVSGIILLFERPVRPGDVVTIGNVSGVVTRIRIRATTVQDWDNKELIVPNRDFITGNLINWTLSSRMLRHVLKVGVAYGSDTRLATELLYKVARENANVAETPEPFVLFDSFGDSTLNFELRVFTQDLSNMMPMRNELMLAVDDEFRKHGVEIAFPQRDLHIRSMPSELAKLGAAGDKNAEDRMLEEARSDASFGYSRDN